MLYHLAAWNVRQILQNVRQFASIFIKKLIECLTFVRQEKYCSTNIIIISQLEAKAENLYSLMWASCQIRKIAGCACAENAGNVFSRHRLQRKLLVSDPGMHHGSCVTHVPWCMSGSLTRGDGENVPGIPDACAFHSVTYLVRGPWILTWDALHNRAPSLYTTDPHEYEHM